MSIVDVSASGVRLRGELHRPVSPSGPVSSRGTVLVRTPYDASTQRALATSWTARGYSCLIQDVRGRYRSSGRWTPYEHEADDGAATIDAILATVHRSGPLLLFGASYAAHCALEAARIRPHLVDGIIVLVPALGRYETAYAGGIPRIYDRIGWWEQHGFHRTSSPGISPTQLATRTARATEIGPVAAAAEWEWTPRQQRNWRQLWSARPIDISARYRFCHQPLLVISGENDFFDAEARAVSEHWPGTATFRTGPWGHGLLSSISDPQTRAQVRAHASPAAFIDEWLASIEPQIAHTRRRDRDTSCLTGELT